MLSSSQENNLKIAFAVYKKEVEFDQQLSSDMAYGESINRLAKKWRWINVRRNFLNSAEVQNFHTQKLNTIQKNEYIFIDWLKRIFEKFLQSESQYLVILNSSLYLPDLFEEKILYHLKGIEGGSIGISLWPVVPINPRTNKISQDLFDSSSLSSLAFLLNKQAAIELLEILHTDSLVNFQEMIIKSRISCYTILEDSADRPFLWLDIVAAEDSHAGKMLESRSSQILEFREETLRTPLKVHAFISHWFSTWENIENVEEACLRSFHKTTVLNTTEVERFGWLNKTPISFFRQFEIACRNFDTSSDYMLFITGDVVSTEWLEFFDYANRVLTFSFVGTFSPSLTYEFHHLGRQQNVFFDTTLPLAITYSNDLVLTYINRNIIFEIVRFFDYFNFAKDTFSPEIGYGLMEIISHVTRSQEIVNIRDRSFTFQHPEGSSYNRTRAEVEREKILIIAERFFAERDQKWSLPQNSKPLSFDVSEMLARLKNVM